MASRDIAVVLVFLVIQSSCLVFGVNIQEFYPDGIDGPRGFSELLTLRVSLPVALGTTYNLYGKPYRSLRVYEDGLITLGEEAISSSPKNHRTFLFPPEAKVIAPFYAPGDVTNTSRISYGETRDPDILTRANRDVRQSFSGEPDFNATAVFVATWYQVKHAHHRQHKKNNTFQAVLVTNGHQTFVIFNYLTQGLQWTKGYHVNWRGAKHAHAQVGFSAGDFVRYSTLPGSGTDQVHRLASKSNMNTPGRWIYKVGWSGMHGVDVQSADSYEIDDSPQVDFIPYQFYEGCFVVHGYLTANRSQIWTDISIRSCMALCFERHQRYAALHNGSQCACLNDIKHLIKTNTDQECNMVCSVDDNEFCGGQMTASVYMTVSGATVQSDQAGGQRKRIDVDECAVGVVSCHANATCINKSPGYCCQCDEGFYGNGITCIEIGAVQRMIGFLSGSVNGQTFKSLNMDTIAFSDDGRAYVSVRAFPPSLAPSARVLTPLTDVVGWMYAKPNPSGFYNGYKVVGARFVRRASLHFDSGEELAILQKYQGKDVRSQFMKVETTMNGAIPRIHPKAVVRMRKFRQEFQRTAAGRIQSRGTVKYQVDGRERYFTVDQFIDHNEQKGCGQHVVRGVLEADVLASSYDPNQAFLAIAVKGTFINTTLDSIDVQGQEADKTCGSKKVTCHKLGVCIQYRGDEECRCNYGYFGDGVTYCNDVDECKLNRYRCAPEADCVNTVGSYRCVCRKGYVGDGKTCRKDSVVQCPRPCGANAKCVKIALGLLCTCNPGYQGDGFDCKSDGTCAGVKCDPNAKCVTSSDKSRKCVCNDGYQGDGQTCTAVEGSCGGVVCNTNAKCVQSKCTCNPGFQGNGKNCSDENECELKTHRCDANADCLNTVGSYRCRCRAGYQGDGFRCQKASASCGGEKCHRFAYCDVDPLTKKQQCLCRRGFRGNGVECLDFNECIPILRTCDVNAVCRNTLGSYECICNRGFILGPDDDKKCIVDDRCNGIKCDVNAHCDAVQGCTCKTGFVGDGKKCTDIDECKSEMTRCDPNADCRNTAGSFTCSCRSGFEGDGVRCRVDNSCSGVVCDVNARCEIQPDDRTRRCVCNNGWQGNGTLCTDVDECQSSQFSCPPNTDCINSDGSYECRCKQGFVKKGSSCVEDDSCGGVTCDPNARCVQTPQGTRQCVCNSGWQKNGNKCIDEDECRTNPCHRNADCINSIGSFTCRCKPGYNGDGRVCNDIDECQSVQSRCPANTDCINREGTYECRCTAGFVSNGSSCVDEDECQTNPCHPNADCFNSIGSFTCRCKPGYNGNGRVCDDIDECQSVQSRCPANTDCINREGTYECPCTTGFVSNGSSCVDEDECRTNPCHRNADCINSIGSFTCRCKPGYNGDGRVCNDIDECQSVQSRCPANTYCINREGTYECRCTAGFVSNGSSCVDEDECQTNPCHRNADCINSIGSFTCRCKPGYNGNGRVCDDIDECQSVQSRCPANTDCINREGTYECPCTTGFVSNGSSCVVDDSCNGVKCDPNAKCVQIAQGVRQCVCNAGWEKNGNTCIDEDECRTNPCHRNADCINSIGSFTCRCKPGYDGNGRVCNDIDECQSVQSRCPANTDCINREGTYECPCTTGFVSNGSSCIVDDSCNGVKCDPNAKCVQIAQGVRQCVCNAGWEKNGNTCIDIDECRASNSPCHPNANCINSIGSFSCRCRPGFKGDGQLCEDDGTCAGVQCHPDATCHKNTAEGTRCVCKTGYLGDGRKCADINECAQGKDECHKHAKCTNTVGSYKCSCNLGYIGNGFNCTDDGSCQGVICDPNAKCVASSPTGGNRTCVCKDGFSGNGEICRDVDECALGHAKCHRKAECVNQVGSYRCRCVRGYVGDGNQCESDGTCEGKVCDFNAVCIATNTTKGIDKTCKCKDGFSGDGIICTDVDECIEDPCPSMSQCVNAFGTYVCQCKPGYRKSNGLCEKICTRCQNGGSCVGENECKCPKGFSGNVCQWYGEASLIYTKGNSVQRMSLPPRSSAIGLVYKHEGMVNVGLDYDCVEEYIYWTEVMEGCIMRAKYDGTGREMVFRRSEVRSPEGLAVDWIGRNLYWTDSGLDVIEVSRLNGTNRKVLISNGLDDPRAILVDPPNRKMYWSDWTRRRPRIEMADMDGTNRRVLVYDDLGLPNGLTLVQTTNELCYTDAGSWSIRCVDLAGLNVRKVLTRVTYPFGIAYFNRTLYWTDWNQNVIHRIGVESSSPDPPLATFVGKTGKIFDVKAVQPCPAKVPKNPCSVNNGGCLGLCLLKPDGHTCSCPKGRFPVRSGNKTTCRGKCDDPLGMEKGLIFDAQLTASSAWNNNHKRHGAHRARLNLDTWPAGWSTKKFDPKPWIQIDLSSPKMVTGVATQGLGKSAGEWVKTYRVAYSDDGVKWHVLRNGGRRKIFVANSDSTTVKRNKFPAAIKTRWLRILPRTWHNHVSMRLELYGC